MNIIKKAKKFKESLAPDQAGLLITVSPADMGHFRQWLATASAEKCVESFDIQLTTGLFTRRVRHEAEVTFTPGLSLDYLKQLLKIDELKATAPEGRGAFKFLAHIG